MPFLPTALIGVSAILLIHSGYSAHEHSLTHLTSPSTIPAALPLDIVIETVIAVALACVGIVLAMASGDSLRPISLRVWAGKLEREKGCGPFAVLDDRNGFLDIRKKREEFTDYMKAEQ